MIVFFCVIVPWFDVCARSVASLPQFFLSLTLHGYGRYALELLPPAELGSHARIIIECLDDRDAKVRSAAQQVAPHLPMQAVADNIELVVEKLCTQVNIGGKARPIALLLVEKCASTPVVLEPHVEQLLSVASDRRIGASQKVTALKALAVAPASCLGIESNATQLIELVNDTGHVCCNVFWSACVEYRHRAFESA